MAHESDSPRWAKSEAAHTAGEAISAMLDANRKSSRTVQWRPDGEGCCFEIIAADGTLLATVHIDENGRVYGDHDEMQDARAWTAGAVGRMMSQPRQSDSRAVINALERAIAQAERYGEALERIAEALNSSDLNDRGRIMRARGVIAGLYEQDADEGDAR
jgi:hypothetical protein